jgi:hypothetical protein
MRLLSVKTREFRIDFDAAAQGAGEPALASRALEAGARAAGVDAAAGRPAPCDETSLRRREPL